MNNMQSVARFDAAASTYDGEAWVQSRAARYLSGWLKAGAVRRVLELGCGTGLFTRHLRGIYPRAQLVAVDASARMLEVARTRAPAVVWRCADIRAWEPEETFDVIASNCSLHWVAPYEALFARMSEWLAPRGQLVFSMMLEGTLAELRESRLRVAPEKPPLGRLPRYDEILTALAEAGWKVRESRVERWQEFHRSAGAFLAHLHRLGVTGGLVSRAERPLTRGELERLEEDYARRYGLLKGGVRATYVVGFFDAGRAS